MSFLIGFGIFLLILELCEYIEMKTKILARKNKIDGEKK